MITNSISKLNENQIALVQQSIEYLYSIQDRESLMKAIVDEASHLVGSGKVYLLVYDHIAKDLIPYSNAKIDRHKVKQLIKVAEDKVLHEGKHDEYVVNRNFWFFPYQENNKFSGVLALSPFSGSLSEELIKMMDIFMQSVPILLENSRLYLLMARKTKSLTLMGQLHQLVNRYSFQEILAEIVEKIGEMLGSEMAGIMLYDPDKNELRLQKPAFGEWSSSMIKQYRMSINEACNAKTVFMTGVPSITNEAFNNSNYNQEMVSLFQAKSIITVPLTVEDKRIGVIHAINKKDQKYFTQIDVQSLTEIGEQLGTLLQGALQLSHQHPTQQDRNEIEQYLSEQLIDLLLHNTEKMEEIEKFSQTLGFDLYAKKSVMLVKLEGEKKYTKELEQYDKKVRKKIFEIIPTALTSYRQGTYCLIVAHQQEEEIKNYSQRINTKLKKFVDHKFARKTNSPPKIYIGIGDAVDSIQDICDSHHQAKQIINILPKMQDSRNIGYYPQLGSWTLLTYVAANKEIVLPFVQYHLNKINQMKDAEIIKETLESYLRNNGQFNKAAEDLFIHPNTLKYRMAKVQDLTGYDLTDSETRLNLNLALRLEKMMGE